MTRRLAPLMTPRSIAFVGASPKPESVGHAMLAGAALGGFSGDVYAVNPKYDEIDGVACYASLDDLPAVPDHAVLAVADHRMEEQLNSAIEAGVKAVTIFGTCYLENDDTPQLVERLAARAREAGLLICGGNCMGFYNNIAETHICASTSPVRLPRGRVALILHSGSVFSAFCDVGARLDYSYVISAGQELTTSAADYLDYILEEGETAVIGLFLETVRDPNGFCRALEMAVERDVPVVVLKVGRTESAAAMALTHSGAMVGNAAAYEALFERYGVIAVETLDEMAATLALFEQPRRAGPGGVASIHDSGGEREMFADLADDLDVPLARISSDTKARLAARLDPGLEPGNPLDAWGTGHDYEAIFRDCFQALVDDRDTSIALYNVDLGDDRSLALSYIRACISAARNSDKPVAMSTNLSNLLHPSGFADLKAAGVPLLEGTAPSLLAARHLLSYRDFRNRAPMERPSAVTPEIQDKWRTRLAAGGTLDEAESLALLADYGLAVPAHRLVKSEDELRAVIDELAFPVVLKTASRDVHHKSDVGGVCLGISEGDGLVRAYREMAARLGPRALIARMMPGGVEMALGLTQDPQFGPLVMVAGGGIFIELLRDRAYALPPVDRNGARRMIDRLTIRPMLDGLRGTPPLDIDALVDAVVRFSALAADLGDLITEADVNPLIVSPQGCVAVDGLIALRRAH
jgi:acyl-CoA synthetase (NDP forming)